jgi:DNA-directed RNA polymerase specialized sigma24 family protein
MKQLSTDSRFQTTLWSVVLRAGGRGGTQQAALEQIYRLYWKPLFVYALSKGLKTEDAEDLTQSFFGWMISRDTLRVADPQRGRFRAFLLTTFKNFIVGEWDRARAMRRGGGAVHLSFDVDFRSSVLPFHSPELTPELAYDRQWALDLVERATHTLRSEHVSAGKGDWFDRIAGPTAGASYLDVADTLETTEEAVKSFAKRARRRFREILEREIADTVGSPEDAAEEMAYLVELLRN